MSAPKNACALACYSMTAKYFFSETTFDQILKISDWSPNYVAWPFKFWKWIMDQGIKITDFDLIDYKRWLNKGVSALKSSLTEKEFDWLRKNSQDLSIIGKDLKKVVEHRNFTHRRGKPKFSDLKSAVKKKSVCEVVLDSRTLDKKEGFSLHRVVVTGINKNKVTFHDPRGNKTIAGRTESLSHFKRAWLVAVSDPELCIYSK
ncbi:MAG TPA: hypothetical protein VMW41_03370 [Candidatus Bathyarchaeia archaeon]|nr:hypothetical protein [Candidatus Bathyarchaeia archaeon]